MNKLSTNDIFALGFMAFALFVGAGNIIFPPMVGLQAGENLWPAIFGFLITAVGLPSLTLVALARVGGGIEALSSPIGAKAGLVLAAVCYLAVGPLMAIPRTTTVSFSLGIEPLIDSWIPAYEAETGRSLALALYSALYFALVIFVSFYPGKLLDSIGRFLAPIKIVALAILGVSAVMFPYGEAIEAVGKYQGSPFSSGFAEGYLTMDTLGAMVFGVIIVSALRSRGIEQSRATVHYTIIASIMAGIGLTLIYLSLFILGSHSGTLTPNAADGAEIIRAYVEVTFGGWGTFFLAVMIMVACLVTSIGLTCACSEFFSRYLPISYRNLVLIIAIFSAFVSNLGLTELIKISIPALIAIYPPCIVLILLSFTTKLWHCEKRVIAPVVTVSLIMGIIDGLKASILSGYLPHWLVDINQGTFLGLLGGDSVWPQWLLHLDRGAIWLVPSVTVFVIAVIYDRANKAPESVSV